MFFVCTNKGFQQRKPIFEHTKKAIISVPHNSIMNFLQPTLCFSCYSKYHRVGGCYNEYHRVGGCYNEWVKVMTKLATFAMCLLTVLSINFSNVSSSR